MARIYLKGDSITDYTFTSDPREERRASYSRKNTL
jgi:hypothetical protein